MAGKVIVCQWVNEGEWLLDDDGTKCPAGFYLGEVDEHGDFCGDTEGPFRNEEEAWGSRRFADDD